MQQDIHALTRMARLCAGRYCANYETAPQTFARGVAPRGQCASACVCTCAHVSVCACPCVVTGGQKPCSFVDDCVCMQVREKMATLTAYVPTNTDFKKVSQQRLQTI